MKTISYCLTTLFIFLLLAAMPMATVLAQEPEAELSPAERAEKAFHDGQEAFYKGQYEEAISLFKQAVSIVPEVAAYGLALGKTYCALGRLDEAEKEFKRVLETHPTNVDAGKELASIYAEREEWQEVLDRLTKLLPYKHDYVMFKSLADAAYNLGKLSEARRYYIEALRFNEKAAFDHYQLGNIYLTESKFQLAAQEYSRAIELGYEDALIHYKLGTAYFNLRNYLGRLELREIPDGTAGEISDNFFLIEAAPGPPDRFHCAPSQSAIYQVKKAVDMGIDVPEAKLLLANIYFHTNRFEQAIQLFLTIEEEIKDEDKELFYSYLSQAYYRTGQYERYLDALKKATEADPEAQRQALVEAHHSIAEHYKRLGDIQNQINYLIRAIEGAPTNAQYHLELGDAYYRQREYKKAAIQWKMTLDLQPDHPEQMRITNLLNKLKREGKL